MREVMKWAYKTKDGNVVGHVIRLENENEPSSSKSRKQIIPYFKENGQSGIPDNLPKAHRIYGMDSIKDFTKPIFITEGEKCAYALHGLGYQAITNLGGCQQGHLADWSVIKEAECVYILPDNDTNGLKYSQGVYNRIKIFPNIKSIKCLSFPLHDKADICDFLKSLPELSGWNEFDSLADHSKRDVIKAAFERYMQDHLKDIPASWKFIFTKNRHKLIAANDFISLELPPRKALLEPWLMEGSINMIFADRGIGKTFFALSCALALTSGTSFLCYNAASAVPVLYLDGEMQANAMKYRIDKLSIGKPTIEPLTIYTPDCQENDYIPDIGTASGREQINEMIEQIGAKVIFIDNISTFDRTGNENEAESWAPIQAWAIQHRKKGRAIIFIHHANKEGKQRGSHKKEDVMDTVIKLKRPDDYIQGEGDTKMLIQYTKARHLSGDMAQDIEASLQSKDDYLQWSYQHGDILYQKTVTMLKDGVPIRDVAEELGIGKSTIHRWKNKAQSDGLL